MDLSVLEPKLSVFPRFSSGRTYGPFKAGCRLAILVSVITCLSSTDTRCDLQGDYQRGIEFPGLQTSQGTIYFASHLSGGSSLAKAPLEFYRDGPTLQTSQLYSSQDQ